jgi:hypothetical protein
MKKFTLTSAIFIAMAATSVVAHHPAKDMLDEEQYEAITDNLEETESPHLDMEDDDIGSAAGAEAGSSGQDQAERALDGWESNQEQSGEVPPVEDPADTMDLLENVDNPGGE